MSDHISVQSILDYKVLLQSPLFDDVDQAVVLNMLSSMQREKWQRGTSLKDDLHDNDKFFLLLKGRVKIGRHHPENGRELTLFLMGPGDGINVLSLDRGHDLHVSALDHVELLSTSRQNWEKWLDEFPRLHSAVTDVATRQVEHLADLASELAMDDAMTRLVHLLLRYFNQPDPTRNLIKNLHQEELAHMIGTVRPVLARMLAELKSDGVIGVEGREINIHNMQKLLDRGSRHPGVHSHN